MDSLDQLNSEIIQSRDSIFVGRDELDQPFSMHSHPKSQMLIVENGVANLRTHGSGYYIPSKHYVWVPKDKMHMLSFKNKGVIIKSIYFNDENDLDHPFYGEIRIFFLKSPLQEMLKLTMDWKGIFKAGEWQHEFLLGLKHLLPHINTNPLKLVLPATDHLRLLPLLDYLNANLSDELSLVEMAQMFGYSVRNLTRIFNKELHQSYGQYLKVLRVINAMELLTSGNKNVTEAAYLVGYSSIAAFSNSFKEITHMRPKEFQLLNI